MILAFGVRFGHKAVYELRKQTGRLRPVEEVIAGTEHTIWRGIIVAESIMPRSRLQSEMPAPAREPALARETHLQLKGWLMPRTLVHVQRNVIEPVQLRSD